MNDAFSEIEQFAEGQAFSDDVCLVGIEIVQLENGAQNAAHPLQA